MRRTVALPPQAGASSTGLSMLLAALAVSIALAGCGSSPPSPSGSAPSQSAAPIESAAPSQSAAPSESPSATLPTESAAATPSVGGLDVCALLPSAKLSKIVGTGTQANAMPAGGWMAGQCALNTAHASLLLSVGTAATIKGFGDPANPDAKARLASYKTQAGPSAKLVPGVGDGAVRSSNGIASYKGGTYLEITIMQPGLTEDQLVKVMQLAVAGIEG